jgi:hypothetical protein
MTTAVVLKNESVNSLEDNYLSKLLSQCEQKNAVIQSDFLFDLKQKAASLLTQSRFPNKRDEEWQFTDISDLLKIDFQVADNFCEEALFELQSSNEKVILPQITRKLKIAILFALYTNWCQQNNDSPIGCTML